MKNYLLLIATFIFTQPLFAQVSRPKLVVGIVLDQMRWDYLYRYNDRYGNDGFKRMMKEGFNVQNTKIDYLPTFTAPGHACIYTGTVPALHGIAANDWINNSDGSAMYCTQDDGVNSVGCESEEGKMSPKNLKASTITDELRLATNFRSRTFGVSIKDRGSILPAGHSANAAYWFDGNSGNFISSTYYMNELPQWLINFNKRNIVDSFLSLDWNTLYPIATYTQSSSDNNRYEGNIKGEKNPVFPHKLSESTGKNNGVIRFTPYGNSIVTLLAKELIAQEKLGQTGYTDFIAVSYSSTDYIGHVYGPNSVEVEDTYLRMDQELATLLKYLDEKLGKGNYLAFLTADHGAAHNPLYLNDQKIPAKSFSEKDWLRNLNNNLFQEFKDSSLVIGLNNYQVSFNKKKIIEQNIDFEQLKFAIKTWLTAQEGVQMVLDMDQPGNSSAPKRIQEMANNGYFAPRSGSLQIIMEPGWFSGYAATGTTHGSWNPYDARIPLLFYGWNIKPGETFEPYNMTDIAPTIAALLKIQEPNACIGKPIEEIMEND